MPAGERRLVYADASALVKFLVIEPETSALGRELDPDGVLVSSAIARVEVSRATKLSNDSVAMAEATTRFLATLELVDVDDTILASAQDLTSRRIRALDAIHLASALRIGADRFLAYDKPLLKAAAEHGLAVWHPGMDTGI